MSEVVHGHIHFKKAGHVLGGQCLNLKFYQAGSAILEMAKGPVNGLAPSLYDTDESCTTSTYYVCIHVDQACRVQILYYTTCKIDTKSSYQFFSIKSDRYLVHGIHMIIREHSAFYNLNIARCIVNSICLMASKLESHCTLQILNE